MVILISPIYYQEQSSPKVASKDHLLQKAYSNKFILSTYVNLKQKKQHPKFDYFTLLRGLIDVKL